MVATNHALAGALIAVAVKQPWLAAPLAYMSHFLLDALPHFWIQVENGDVRTRNAGLMFKVVTRTDAFLAALSVITLPWILHQTASWWVVLVCVLAAMLPDFYWVYLFIKDGKSGKQTQKKGSAKFHKKIQRLERPWALPIDISFFVTGVILVGISR